MSRHTAADPRASDNDEDDDDDSQAENFSRPSDRLKSRRTRAADRWRPIEWPARRPAADCLDKLCATKAATAVSHRVTAGAESFGGLIEIVALRRRSDQ